MPVAAKLHTAVLLAAASVMRVAAAPSEAVLSEVQMLLAAGISGNSSGTQLPAGPQ